MAENNQIFQHLSLYVYLLVSMWVADDNFVYSIIVFLCIPLAPSLSSITNVLSFRQKRIIGGMNASIEERWAFAPSLKIITIGEEEFGQCGATIISKRHLLTAAHCIINLVNVAGNKDIKIIRDADYFLADLRLINDIDDNNFHSYNVTNRTYIHHNYNYDKFTNDIAVVEYPEDFDFGIEPIRLAADFIENEGEMAFAVGYGKYRPNDSENLTHSYYLREGVFVFREAEYCSQTWTRPNIDRKICSGEYGRGTALGDSGGPLMKNGDDGKWYQVGICSYGKRNSYYDRKTYPGISTRVSYYCPWIAKVTKGEVKCHPYERLTKSNVAEDLLFEKVFNMENNAHLLTINKFVLIMISFTMIF